MNALKIIILYIFLFTSLIEAKFIRDTTRSIVLDTKTNLIWEDRGEVASITSNWLTAVSNCESLSLGGFSDWRLPNINELESIIDDQKVNPAIISPFVNTADDKYWSSTMSKKDIGDAWYVSFDDGHSDDYNISLNAYSRCVRSGITDITMTHNGIEYKVVTSPYTSKVWLDRNLGASRTCTAYNDTSCYGWYYQWGRGHDGHQESNSSTTNTLAFNFTPHNQFIKNGDSPYDWTASNEDDTGSLRSFDWSKSDGTSICPIGFRVPTINELKAETSNISGFNNNNDAFESFLKLPSAGARDQFSGSMIAQGTYSYLWSSTANGAYADGIYSSSSNAYFDDYNRGIALTVRCIKD